MNQNLESRTIPLKVGDTKISEITRRYKGENYHFTVFYGNRLFPKTKDGYIHLDPEDYKRILHKFLNSEKGQKYIWPTDDEDEDACKFVLSVEVQEIRKQKEEAEQKAQQQAIKQQVVEQPIQNPVDELELINLQKRVKVMLIVIVIQLLAIIALVALRLIKL